MLRKAYIEVDTRLTEEEFENWISELLFPISSNPEASIVRLIENEVPRCCVCETTENLHRDGDGWRCDSPNCVCF